MTIERVEFLKIVGENVRRLCASKQWSLRRLAHESGESVSTVQRMANGTHEVGHYSATRIAAALGTKTASLEIERRDKVVA